MNIFYLDHDPKLCAQYHNNKNTVKMILEYCQLLSVAHRVIDADCLSEEYNQKLYKMTHRNNPCALWVRESHQHYLWLHSLLVELCKEFTFRYEKVHKAEREGLVDLLGRLPAGIPMGSFTQPPQIMDESMRLPDAIEAYRNLYMTTKRYLAEWKKREIPFWFS